MSATHATTQQQLVVLEPAPNGRLRLTLSKAAVAGGAKSLQFVHVSASRTDPVCADLSQQIQATALADRQGIPWWMWGPIAALPVGIALG